MRNRSKRRWLTAVLLPISLAIVHTSQPAGAAPQSDLVDGTTLPGWNRPTPSRWFSGFLRVGASEKRLHYLLVEAEKVSPEKAPVILWLNGGPGCSSLEGFFYEHGPLVVADAHAPPNINWDGANSTTPNPNLLVENKWSWNKVATIVYLEAPAGVGFSYSSNTEDTITGDNQTATDSWMALEYLFEEIFPELRRNEFYVSGESYGGVYVPTLALKLYQSGNFPQLKGLLIGNGVFDRTDAASTHAHFAYGHGLLSTPQYTKILKACSDGFVDPSDECKEALSVINKNMVDVNPYDAFRSCYHPTITPETAALTPQDFLLQPWSLDGMVDGSSIKSEWHELMQQVHVVTTRRRLMRQRNATGISVPCINSVLGTKYLNNPVVKQALHVETSPNQEWAVCGGVHYHDDGIFPSMIAVYQQLLKAYQPRILVYNGDVDIICNYLWAELSVAKFGKDVEEEWRPWVYGGVTDDEKNVVVGEQLGGYVTTYDDRNISFVTIHGAGHMSPQWRPEAVFTMLKAFLNGRPLQHPLVASYKP